MLKVYLGIFSAIFFWGSAFVGISMGLESFSPTVLALGRSFVAFVLVLLLSIKRPTLTPVLFFDRIKAFFLGMLGMGLYSLALAFGERTVSAGVASFVVGQMPLIASLLAAFFLKEKVKRRLWVGICISILGLYLITLGETHSFHLSLDLGCTALSALCGACYTCMHKSVVKRMTTMVFIRHAILGSLCFLITIAVLRHSPILFELKQASMKSISAVLYLGALPSLVAYLGWSYAISRVNVAKAGSLLYAMPFVGGILAWFILLERPTTLALVGMSLAFVGCIIGSLKIPQRSQKTLPAR